VINLHYWPTPNGHKITLFLEESGGGRLPPALSPRGRSRVGGKGPACAAALCFLSQLTAKPMSRVGAPTVQGRRRCKQQLTRNLSFVRVAGVSM
jgi:hypothetical protein